MSDYVPPRVDDDGYVTVPLTGDRFCPACEMQGRPCARHAEEARRADLRRQTAGLLQAMPPTPLRTPLRPATTKGRIVRWALAYIRNRYGIPR